MKLVRRLLMTFAATGLLCLAGAAVAVPAQADPNLGIPLGDLVKNPGNAVDVTGVVDTVADMLNK
ncbi:hypothetical protein [Streptomyces sp. NPDC037389]|uniref:hypothetical protein n=1 Tax=Streptomyces sp. NPDC037389 TaxID=3155369 RepID=UPI0033EBE3D9